jgi:hypothetical protein
VSADAVEPAPPRRRNGYRLSPRTEGERLRLEQRRAAIEAAREAAVEVVVDGQVYLLLRLPPAQRV